MEIFFQIETDFVHKVDQDLLKKGLTATIEHMGEEPENRTLTVVITNTETIRALNLQYRGVDAATDVLAFAHLPEPGFPHLDPAHLGDVVIAYPVAEAQASAAGHTPQEEIVLLAVHGLLHLLGLDHEEAANRAEMWAIQQQIMTEVGLPYVHPTEH